MSALIGRMQEVREQGPAAIQPLQEAEAAAPGFKALPQYLMGEEGELSNEQWVQEMLQRVQMFFSTIAAYIRSHRTYVLSSVPNQFKIAGYWDPAASGTEGGFGAFMLDCHLTSAATGRACPANCPHCQQKLPKWTREQHLQNTACSMGFFDRSDHHSALTAALEQGQLQQAASGQHSIGGFSFHPVLDHRHAR